MSEKSHFNVLQLETVNLVQFKIITKILTKFSIAVDDSSHNEFEDWVAAADGKLNGK